MAAFCKSQVMEDQTSKSHDESNCPPGCESNICPKSCQYKKSTWTRSQLIFTAMGILVAVFATYMIVSTDSNLYLVFWICYSVLRRLMIKSRSKNKTA